MSSRGVYSLEPLTWKQRDLIEAEGWKINILPRDLSQISKAETKHHIEVLIARDRDDILSICKICPELKFLYIISTGVEKLPFKLLKEKGITVVNAGSIGSGIMSEYVLGYILAYTTKVCENYKNQSLGLWKKYQCVEPLYGKTILIVGAGETGRKVAEKASVFGMKCVGVKKHVQNLPFFDKVVTLDLIDEMLPEADFVVCTIPHTPETENLFDKCKFIKMKRGSMFINISRGKLVVEKDLVEALNEGIISQAVLDVFEKEPLDVDSPLWNIKNLLITPHEAGRLPDFMDKAIEVFIKNFDSYINGKNVPNRINLNNGY